MTKIQLLSDLHIEFEAFPLYVNDADVLILAGDIHVKEKGIKWLLESGVEIPVLYVLGNHEYYGASYPTLIEKMRELCSQTNIRVMENDSIKIDEINFFGCTLWTDFELFGNARIAGYHCQQIMNDYKKIRRLPNYSKMRSVDVARIHYQSRSWLEKELKKHVGETNIVISHHAPSIRSLPAHRQDNMESAAYASDLESLIADCEINYWVHGHIHHSANYMIDQCKVMCNPKGYPDNLNGGFDPELKIEI